jgi:hypothetical protein
MVCSLSLTALAFNFTSHDKTSELLEIELVVLASGMREETGMIEEVVEEEHES